MSHNEIVVSLCCARLGEPRVGGILERPCYMDALREWKMFCVDQQILIAADLIWIVMVVI